MPCPKHLRDIDGKKQCRKQYRLSCCNCQVLDEFTDTDVHRKVVWLACYHYRVRSVGGNNVAQDASLCRLNNCTHWRASVNLRLVSVALKHLYNLLCKLAQILVLVLELNYFFRNHGTWIDMAAIYYY